MLQSQVLAALSHSKHQLHGVGEVILMAAPTYQLFIVSPHFGVVLSLFSLLSALTVLLVSLEMFMDQMGQILSSLGRVFCTLGWAGNKE